MQKLGKTPIFHLRQKPMQRLDNSEEVWSGRLDLNQRLPAPEAGALPGCATPRRFYTKKIEQESQVLSSFCFSRECFYDINHWGSGERFIFWNLRIFSRPSLWALFVIEISCTGGLRSDEKRWPTYRAGRWFGQR